MRKLLFVLPVLFVAGCMSTPSKPTTNAYQALDCPALEAERLKLVAELDKLPASDGAAIDATRAKVDAVGAVQVEKGCAG